MRYWIPYAFIRIVVFLIAGILLGVFAPGIFSFRVAGAAFAFLVITYFTFWFLNYRAGRLIINTGLTGLLAIFAAGYLTFLLNDERRHADHLAHHQSVTYYRGVAVTPAQEKENSWKQVFEISMVHTDSTWRGARGKVIVYLPKKVYPEPFQYGDQLVVRGAPALVKGALNPGEFDYARFLSYRNIYHQHFLRDSSAMFIGRAVPSELLALSFRIREWCSSRIAVLVAGEREQAIASALVLGIVDNIDAEISQAYAATGAMHVLAVSGLHVGVMYVLLGMILRPLKRFKWGAWSAAFISIFILWAYACVTGLSPSVLRAVMMFSFIALAQPLKHRTNIYNILGASAFCLLLYDPMLLMSVGFQLSYLAVAGIVYMQPLLYRWYEPESRVLDEIWKITSVSIAAQLATVGITLLYFHQFPNYFLMSNLYVIPMAFVILIVGLAALAVSFIPYVAPALGLVLEWLIKILNYLILFTEQLPWSVTDNIYISPWQCVLLMLIIIAAVLMFQQRRIHFFFAFAVLILLFSFTLWQQHLDTFRAARLTVYAVRGHSAYDIMHSGTTWFFADSALAADRRQTGFHITPNRMQSRAFTTFGGENHPGITKFHSGEAVFYRGKTLLRLDAVPPVLPAQLSVDYLILSGSAVKNAEKLLSKIQAREIILDSSNSYFVVDKVYNSLTQKYRIHSVWHHGAFDTRL